MILLAKQHETIHLRLLMLFAFLLPLHPRLATLSIIFLGLHWLITRSLFQNFKYLLQPIPIVFISFYLLHLIGLTYTSNMVEGLQKIETKLPLIVFPLILFTFPIKKEQSIFFILKSFVGGCLLASGFCFFKALLKNFETGENWMFYKKLGGFLDFHPTYFSMYLSFALFTALFFLVKNFKTISGKSKLGSYFLLSWFYLFILLLASRMTILATSLILGITFLIWMFSNKKIWQGIGISLLAILMLGIVVKKLPGLKKRTNVTIERVEKQNQKKGVSDLRINLWSAAVEVIKNNPVKGVGTGDAQDELVNMYQNKNFEKEFRNKFNPHNQYLQTTVTLGIVGGTLFLIYLLLPFRFALQQRDYLYLLFLSLLLLSFLTESILQTQRGTLFFGFFHTLLASKFFCKKET